MKFSKPSGQRLAWFSHQYAVKNSLTEGLRMEALLAGILWNKLKPANNGRARWGLLGKVHGFQYLQVAYLRWQARVLLEALGHHARLRAFQVHFPNAPWSSHHCLDKPRVRSKKFLIKYLRWIWSSIRCRHDKGQPDQQRLTPEILVPEL